MTDFNIDEKTPPFRLRKISFDETNFAPILVGVAGFIPFYILEDLHQENQRFVIIFQHKLKQRIV